MDRSHGLQMAGARGVQVGDGNFQVNYHIISRGDRLTVTDGMNRPPLVDSSGTVESPYRGLGAFSERDAPFFHGRETAIGEILGLLSEAAQSGGLLVVSGVSGAGKSSLLRAGVLPRIRGEGLASAPGAARWTGLVLTPTREPLEQLALQAAGLLGTDAAGMHANLAGNPASFATTAQQLALRFAPPEGDSAGRVLLIVDQFEQVFTQCTDDGQRRKFVSALCSAAATGAALAVIVVRADFEARCADFPELVPAVRNHRYLVTAMDELELRIAIERPVATLAASSEQSLSVEASLVDYLVREMVEAPGLSVSGAGALPLLSHALDQAWRNRSGPVLTLADYQRGGRIQGAVAASADHAFGLLTPSRQEVARQVFLRLTTTSDDGTTARDRVPREELLEAAGPDRRDDVAGVLDTFTTERLITQAAADVEISHDALLTAWPLLRDEWLAGSRADLAIASRLRDTARKWAAGGRKPGLLYRDEVLDEAAGAMSRMTAAAGQLPAPSTEEDAFLRASVQVRRNAARLRTIIRSALATLTACLAVAVAVASVSLLNANRNLNTSHIQQLDAVSAALHDSDPAVSRLAAAGAWHAAPAEDQTRDLATEAAANPLIGEFDAVLGPMAVSPDGSILAVSDPWPIPAGPSGSTGLTLWSMTKQALIGYPPISANSVAFSPVEHGHAPIFAATTPNGVGLYQVITGLSAPRLLRTWRTVDAGGDPIEIPIAFSGDGMLAMSATTGGAGDIWLFADTNGRYPASPTYVIPNKKAVDSLSFAPDGSLAVGTSSGVSVYPPKDGYSTRSASISEKARNTTTCAQFSADGLLTVTSVAGTVVDRYANGALTSVPLLSQTGQDSGEEVEGAAIVGSGPGEVATEGAAISSQDVLAVAEDDGLHLYVASKAATSFVDMTTIPYPGQQKPDEVDVEFTPDGNTLIENIAGQVYIYDTRLLTGTTHTAIPVQAESPTVTLGPANPGMSFDPADPAILAVAGPGAVSLVNVTAGQATILPGTAGASWLSFAPSGALALVTAAGVRLLPDPLHHPARSRLVAGTSGAVQVTFSPAGAMAVSADPGLIVFPPGNTSAGKVIKPRIRGAEASDPVFGPDGQLAAAVTDVEDDQLGVAVFAPGTYAQQGYIEEDEVPDPALAFAPDGALAIGTRTAIQVYGPGSYQHPVTIGGAYVPDLSGNNWLTVGYYWLAFSRSGILVSADASTGVTLWDTETGQNLATFAVATHENLFGVQLAISPDGKYVAFDSDIAAESASGRSLGAEVTTIWSTPYLDGNVADGVAALCDQLGGAPVPGQWGQYFTSSLPYPRVCKP